MNHRFLYVLALMLIFAIPVMPGYAAQSQYFAASSYWGFNSTVLTAYPGAYNMPLTVQVRYIGPVTLYNVSLKVVPGFPITPARGQGNITLSIPEITPGTTLTLFGLFNVSPRASTMVYNESIKASYTVLGPQGIEPGSQLVNFSLPVTGFYGIKLAGFRTCPAVIYSGERAGELKAFLVNYGNVQVQNLSVSITYHGPLAPLYAGSSSAFIAYLPPGQPINLTFPFSLESSEAGNYSSTIFVSSTAGSWNITVPIEVLPSANFTLSSESYGAVNSGSSDAYVTIQIENSGSAEARFVTATMLFNPVFTPYAPSSENPIIAAESVNSTLGNMIPGQLSNATYVISVSSGLKPGTYYLPILISWYQEPTMQLMHQVIEVPIKISPAFSLFDGSSLILTVAAIVIAVLAVMVVLGRRRK
ncbi:MAG: COG1361 S-layer family protein [Nitrososphaeria archaeon]